MLRRYVRTSLAEISACNPHLQTSIVGIQMTNLPILQLHDLANCAILHLLGFLLLGK